MITCNFEDGGPAKLRHVTTSLIVLNETGDQVLLVMRAPESFTCPNLWALPGGFFDHGEYLEAAALRELKEETGYTGKIESLFRIVDNPVRPLEDRANVDFVFVVRALSTSNIHDHEISEVKWFPLNSIPEKSEWAFDHWEDLELYKQHLNKPFSLPLLGKIEV